MESLVVLTFVSEENSASSKLMCTDKQQRRRTGIRTELALQITLRFRVLLMLAKHEITE